MLNPRRRRLPAGIWPVVYAGKNRLSAPLLLALAIAFVAALVMPQQSPFPYRFKKNGVWSYPALKAPFDFAVLHPEATVRDQLAKVQAEHAPYYRINQDVGRQEKERLKDFIETRKQVSGKDLQYEDLVKNPGRYLSYGQHLLDHLYAQGIADPALEALQKEDPGAPVFLVQNNQEQRTQARAVRTLQAARSFLIDTLPYSTLSQPELLLPVLENALSPNVFYDDSLTQARKGQKIAAVRSTGISVRKGELIVKKGEWISETVYQKLDSLNQRYEVPNGWLLVAGYALLAFPGFALFFFWLKKEQPAIWNNRENLLLAPAMILFLLFLLNVGNWIGPAVTLLFPLWGLPYVLRRKLNSSAGWAAWLLLLLLSTFATDWSAGWLAIQMTGAGALYFLLPMRKGWLQRLGSMLFTTAFQVIAWWAGSLAGKIPPILQSADSLLFLLLANGMLLVLLPLSRDMEKSIQS